MFAERQGNFVFFGEIYKFLQVADEVPARVKREVAFCDENFAILGAAISAEFLAGAIQLFLADAAICECDSDAVIVVEEFVFLGIEAADIAEDDIQASHTVIDAFTNQSVIEV